MTIPVAGSAQVQISNEYNCVVSVEAWPRRRTAMETPA
jgi:hypothetical protein